jgi:hypothetical protein
LNVARLLEIVDEVATLQERQERVDGQIAEWQVLADHLRRRLEGLPMIRPAAPEPESEGGDND